MLVNCADRPIARIGQRSRSEDRVCRRKDGQTSTTDIHEIQSSSLGLLLVILLILLPAAKHKAIIASALGLLGVAISHSGDLLIEDAIVDVGLFGVEVFVKRSSDDAIRVHNYAKLLSDIC